MRGGYLHNEAMAAELGATLKKCGARVWTEYPVEPGRRAGAVDIYAELGSVRLACEIELGPRRVLQDVKKAEALDVDLLLIVTPTATVARRIRAKLRTSAESRVRVRVLAMGLAAKYLSEMSEGDHGRDTNTRTPWQLGDKQ